MKHAALLLATVVWLAVACDNDDQPSATPTSTPVTTAPATATGAASPASTAAATAAPSTGTTSPTNIAALNGLRCVGQWRNTTFGSTGAFAARLEVGGGGGALTLELGGNVFGGTGTVTEVPFRQVGNELEIEAHTASIGHLSARIGLDGKATGSLQGVPALGPRSQVRVTDYSFVNNSLRIGVNIDFGDGRPIAQSVVEAACSR